MSRQRLVNLRYNGLKTPCHMAINMIKLPYGNNERSNNDGRGASSTTQRVRMESLRAQTRRERVPVCSEVASGRSVYLTSLPIAKNNRSRGSQENRSLSSTIKKAGIHQLIKNSVAVSLPLTDLGPEKASLSITLPISIVHTPCHMSQVCTQEWVCVQESVPMLGEDHITARKRHFYICDNNLCAAVILNEFTYDFCREGYNPLGEYPKQVAYTHQKLVHKMADFFTIEEVNAALLFLIHKKGYITAIWENKDRNGEQDIEFARRIFIVKVYWQKIETDCKPYYTELDAIHAREQKELQSQINAEYTKSPPPPGPEEIARAKQEAMIATERKRVEHHIKRAKELNLHATLTFEQWIETLNHFDWKCAYCPSGDYELLEHFIPINHEGGTTQLNCVPSCRSCNCIKKGWHPSRLPYTNKKRTQIVLEGIKRVRLYLESINPDNHSQDGYVDIDVLSSTDESEEI